LIYTLPDSGEFGWDETTAETPERIKRPPPALLRSRAEDSTRLDLHLVTIPFDLARSEVFFLTGDKIVVGRNWKDPTINLQLPMLQVSKRHATISRLALEGTEVWMLVDNNSRNGTKLNGHPLSAGHHCMLRDMDVIVFGRIRAGFYLPGSIWTLLSNITAMKERLPR
jgi:pSer/pThr/pTyr-binding forkhead associated (FHA) protein